jgi:hypothetical protein
MQRVWSRRNYVARNCMNLIELTLSGIQRREKSRITLNKHGRY